MLPPSLKRRDPAAGARYSIFSAAGDAGPPAAAAAAVFMELRKPLLLSWDVVLAPTVPEEAEHGQTAGSGVELTTVAAGEEATVVAVVVVEGEDEVEGRVGAGKKASTAVEGGSGEGGDETKDLCVNRGRGGGGEGEGAGAARGERGATAGTQEEDEGARGETGFECARPRDPAWARLVFADRKR